MQYRKIDTDADVSAFQIGPDAEYPQWFSDGVTDGQVTANADGSYTLNDPAGAQTANVGGWIVYSEVGISAVPADIFAATYQAIEAESA